MRRILLTGAMGFIGRHVIAPLQALGFEVHAISRTDVQGGDGSVTVHNADLFDPQQVKAALRDAQASHLLHLAWDTEPGKFWRSAKNLEWVAASLRLVQDFVAGGGSRVVLAGTCAEYEWGSARLIEDVTPCSPHTLYGVAKDALRRVVTTYAEQESFSLAWGRVFFLYGPGEKSGRLVRDAIQSLKAGEPFAASHGRQRRDFMSVIDVGRAFACLAASSVSGCVNIGTGSAVPIATLLHEVGSQLGREDLIRLGALAAPKSDPDIIEAAIERLSGEVKFKPSLSLADGVAAAIADLMT